MRRTFAKLDRTLAAFEEELRKALLNCARLKRAREQRQSKKVHPPPRLTIVTER
jgi:hypothetical protein